VSTPDPITRLNAALSGRYRVDSELGEGGMATVYLADDLKHERRVALKVLKPELAAVVGAERFLAEIKTTANLQHPHVLPLFDSGEADSFLFYVMPYVEGETLRDRIDREKQLSVDEAVRITAAVSSALQHAHERGVIHRDIKPANILLQGGQPVVADFGIALAVSAGGGNRLTETGLSVGTPYYMSPEQATGESTIGPQSDLYALSCVLYEMLVGAPPYVGSTAQAVLGQIIAGSAKPATQLRPTVPANVDSALRKGLEKVPADRFASAEAFSRALEDANFRYGVPAVREDSGRWRMVAAASIAVTLSTLAWATLGQQEARPFFDVGLPFDAPIDFRARLAFDLSPDASFIVYETSIDGTQMLRYHSLRDGEGRAIQGTEGASGGPRLSPDGRTVAFVVGAEMFTVPIEGGRRTKVANVSDPYGVWLDDGRIMIADEDGRILKFIDPIQQSTQEIPSHYCISPWPLPGGERVLCGGGDSKYAHWWDLVNPGVDAWEPVRVEGPASGDGASSMLRGADFRIIDEDYLVYVSVDGALRGTRIRSLDPFVVGSSVPLFSGLRRESYTGTGQYDVSEDGTLVYVDGGNAEVGRFVQVPGQGDRVAAPLPIEPSLIVRWAPSPDGRRLAAVVEELQVQQLRVYDLSTGAHSVWQEAHRIGQPRWTPDGRELVVPLFSDPRSAVLVMGSPDDVRPPRTLIESGRADSWPSTFLDEETLLLGSGDGTPASVLHLTTDSVTVDYLPMTSLFISASPDGEFLVFQADGASEIFLQRYPGVGSRYPISDVGVDPSWVSSTAFVYYVTRAGLGLGPGVEWRRVTVDDGPDGVRWSEEVWFTDPDFIDTPGPSYIVTPDEGFIYVQSLDVTDVGRYVRVIPDWVEQMKRAVDEAN
jgi:serine/threonine-protein kinase